MDVDTPGRTGRLLQGFKQLWQDGSLSDVTLQTGDGQRFAAHRALLAAASDYFMAMFTGDMMERDQDTVVLHGVTASGLQPLLEFIYTGTLSLNDRNVLAVIAASAHLQLAFALPPCVHFLTRSVAIDNCVDILNAAKTYQLGLVQAGPGCHIERDAFAYICTHFEDIVTFDHHFRLDAQTLLQCLTATSNEDGTVDLMRYGPEVDLFRCLLDWHRSKKETPTYNNIRFALMTPSELDEVKGIIKTGGEGLEDCQTLLEEAVEYHSLPMHVQVTRCQSTNFRVRNRPCVVTLAQNNSSGAIRFWILSSVSGCPPPADEKRSLEWLQIPQMDHNIHASIQHEFKVDNWVAVRGFLVVCGETQQGNLRCYMLDSRTFLWSPMASMNVPRTSAPLVECNGDVFSLGGLLHGKDDAPSDVIERYDFEQGRWELVGHMPQALYNQGACSFAGKIFMYGARCADGTLSQSMYIYEPVTQTWTERWYRFPVEDRPCMHALFGRVYAAEPQAGSMSYHVPAERPDTWWGFYMRERNLVPVRNRHAVFLEDSVFFIGGSHSRTNSRAGHGVQIGEAAQLGEDGRSCAQVTVSRNCSMSGNPIPQPDYPQGWTPLLAVDLRLPWDVVRQAKAAD